MPHLRVFRLQLLAAIALGAGVPGCASSAGNPDANATDASATDAVAPPPDTPAALDAPASLDAPAASDAPASPDGALPTSCAGGGSYAMQCFSPSEALRNAEYPPGEFAPREGPRDVPPEDRYANGCIAPRRITSGCCNPAVAFAPVDGRCCYVFCDQGCCGRPFVLDGAARVAPLARDPAGSWLTALPAPAPCALAPDERAALARAWRDDAQLEHASIAAFARFTLELLALGAPAELVAEAQRAGLDEVVHARLALSLAARLDDAPHAPGPLALAGLALAPTLAEAAAATAREGCVGETVSALLASEAARHAVEPATREALARVADDEARHAALAWRFVAWALANDGDDGAVRAAVERAFTEALARPEALPRPTYARGVRDATASAYGRLDPRTAEALLAQATRSVLAPCVAALLERPARGVAGELEPQLSI